MKKFKVSFKGFAYVEAEDAEEAKEKFEDGDYAFCEYGCEATEEVQEFSVVW